MALPYMQWYPSDYVAATAHLTLGEDGLYRRLIDLLWMEGGSVPSDERWLRKRLRVTPAEWEEHWPAVVELVNDDGEQITQGRVEREMQKASARVEAARKAGRRSGEVRSSNARSTTVQREANDRRRSTNQNQNHIQKPPDGGKARARAAADLPPAAALGYELCCRAMGAKPDAAWLAGLLEEPEWGSLKLGQELRDCAEYWSERKKPKSHKRAIRSWLRKAVEISAERQPSLAAARPVAATPPGEQRPEVHQTPEAASRWERVLEQLGATMDPHTFDTWIRPAAAVAYDNDADTLTVAVPNEIFQDWLTERHGDAIAEAAGVAYVVVVVARPVRHEQRREVVAGRQR